MYSDLIIFLRKKVCFFSPLEKIMACAAILRLMCPCNMHTVTTGHWVISSPAGWLAQEPTAMSPTCHMQHTISCGCLWGISFLQGCVIPAVKIIWKTGLVTHSFCPLIVLPASASTAPYTARRHRGSGATSLAISPQLERPIQSHQDRQWTSCLTSVICR